MITSETAGQASMNLLRVGMERARLSPLMAAVLGALLIFTSIAGYYAGHSVLAPLTMEPVPKSEWRPPSVVNSSRSIAFFDRTDTQTLTRPIFSKSRRPSTRDDQQAVASVQPAAAAPLPSGVDLKAVVIHGKDKSAFIVCDAFPEGKWMKEGDTLQSWTISAMHELDVILKNGDQTSQLTIDYSEKGKVQPQTPISRNASDPVFVRDAKGHRG